MIEFTIPLRTQTSGVNLREHFRARARRVKSERNQTALAIRIATRGNPPPVLPLEVRLVRFGPTNGLDDDNLPGALKAVRDQIAAWPGIDDRSPDVRWHYHQTRTKYEWGVLVEIKRGTHELRHQNPQQATRV